MNLEISKDFSWNIRSLGNLIELTGGSDISSRITSVDALVNVIKFLTSYHFCCGNEDEKYHLIQAERKGVFKDITGIFFNKLLSLVISSFHYRFI